MATKQITTWDEFKTALTETVTEKTTYEIMNDIDVSDTVISSAITCADSNYWKIFKPAGGTNSVQINGITSYLAPSGADGIIRMQKNTGLSFRHVHFSNLMLATTYLFRGYNDYNCALELNDCLVNGMVKCLCYRQGNESIIFSRCSLNLKCNALSLHTITLNNCWVHMEPLSETNELIASPSGVPAIGSNNYFEGILKRTAAQVGSSTLLAGRALNNVFNFDITLTDNPNSVILSIPDLDGYTTDATKSSIVNISKIKNANGTTPTVTASATGFPYLLTDTQMKSKTYIQQNTNFPLYG